MRRKNKIQFKRNLLKIIAVVVLVVLIALIANDLFLSKISLSSIDSRKNPSLKQITNNFVELSPTQSRRNSGSDQLTPDTTGGKEHSTQWSNDGHQTPVSQNWNNGDHEYYNSLWQEEGHLYTVSKDWSEVEHAILFTNEQMGGIKWWDFGHSTIHSSSTNHIIFTSSEWVDDGHIQTISHAFVEQGHNIDNSRADMLG